MADINCSWQVKSGFSYIDGRVKHCPFHSNPGHSKPYSPGAKCGDWCALFCVASDGVRLGCGPVTYKFIGPNLPFFEV